MRSHNNVAVSEVECIAETLDRAEATIGLMDRLLNFLILVASALEVARKFFEPLPYVGIALFVLLQMLNIVIVNLKEEDPENGHSRPTQVINRALKTFAAATVLTLAIIGLVISAPYLPFIFAGIGAALRMWDFGVAVYNWATSTSTDESSKKVLRGAIVEKALLIVVSVLTIATLIAAGPIVGSAILLVVGAGMLAYKYGLIQKVMNKIFNNPFKGAEMTVEESAPTPAPAVQFDTKAIFQAGGMKKETKKVSTETKLPVYTAIYSQRMSTRLAKKMMARNDAPIVEERVRAVAGK